MHENLILTFDLGTTRLKAALFSETGELRGQITRRNEDRIEGSNETQSADRWWNDCLSAAKSLIDQHVATGQIIGISLSGRAGAAVFLDQNDEVLIDPWHDTRHLSHQRTLVKAIPGIPNYAAALLSKFQWLRQAQPNVAARVHQVLYAKDFLFFKLTGKAITDPASGPDGQWQTEWLDSVEVRESQLPSVEMPWSIGGVLTRSSAREMSLPDGIPVAVGAHDGICANTGAGVIAPGQMALTLGTHCVARMLTTEVPASALRFYGFDKDVHVIGGNALMAGRAFDWFLDQFASPVLSQNDQEDISQTRNELFRRMDAEGDRVVIGANGVRFVPHLKGQLSPTRRPNARAMFFGMTERSTRADHYRAVMEGSSFAIAEVVDQVANWCGEPTRIALTGSGSGSEVWVQMLADILDKPLEITDIASEGRGAAIFCATALGIYPTLGDAVRNMVHVSRTVSPVRNRTPSYNPVREQWKQLIKATEKLDQLS